MVVGLFYFVLCFVECVCVCVDACVLFCSNYDPRVLSSCVLRLYVRICVWCASFVLACCVFSLAMLVFACVVFGGFCFVMFCLGSILMRCRCVVFFILCLFVIIVCGCYVFSGVVGCAGAPVIVIVYCCFVMCV